MALTAGSKDYKNDGILFSIKSNLADMYGDILNGLFDTGYAHFKSARLSFLSGDYSAALNSFESADQYIDILLNIHKCVYELDEFRIF